MELNFLGTVSITRQVLPHMMQQRAGSIVTISSIVGLAGAPLGTGYSATKHALQVKGDRCLCCGFPLSSGKVATHLDSYHDLCCPQGFFNSLRPELTDFPNIHISTVCPGPVISKIVQNAFTEDVNKVIYILFVKLLIMKFFFYNDSTLGLFL